MFRPWLARLAKQSLYLTRRVSTEASGHQLIAGRFSWGRRRHQSCSSRSYRTTGAREPLHRAIARPPDPYRLLEGRGMCLAGRHRGSLPPQSEAQGGMRTMVRTGGEVGRQASRNTAEAEGQPAAVAAEGERAGRWGTSSRPRMVCVQLGRKPVQSLAGAGGGDEHAQEGGHLGCTVAQKGIPLDTVCMNVQYVWISWVATTILLVLAHAAARESVTDPCLPSPR